MIQVRSIGPESGQFGPNSTAFGPKMTRPLATSALSMESCESQQLARPTKAEAAFGIWLCRCRQDDYVRGVKISIRWKCHNLRLLSMLRRMLEIGVEMAHSLPRRLRGHAIRFLVRLCAGCATICPAWPRSSDVPTCCSAVGPSLSNLRNSARRRSTSGQLQHAQVAPRACKRNLVAHCPLLAQGSGLVRMPGCGNETIIPNPCRRPTVLAWRQDSHPVIWMLMGKLVRRPLMREHDVRVLFRPMVWRGMASRASAKRCCGNPSAEFDSTHLHSHGPRICLPWLVIVWVWSPLLVMVAGGACQTHRLIRRLAVDLHQCLHQCLTCTRRYPGPQLRNRAAGIHPSPSRAFHAHISSTSPRLPHAPGEVPGGGSLSHSVFLAATARRHHRFTPSLVVPRHCVASRCCHCSHRARGRTDRGAHAHVCEGACMPLHM